MKPNRPLRGFTLIELLTVIAIIAVLVALLMPAVNAMIAQSARTKATAQALMIANAIKNYHAEYGEWPGQQSYVLGVSVFDGKALESEILDALLNNPRGKRFIEPEARWISGTGTLQDPWQREFYIAMDETGDRKVDIDADLGSLNFKTQVSNELVCVFSWGPKPENEKKRVQSWER